MMLYINNTMSLEMEFTHLPTYLPTYFALNVEYRSPWAEIASPSPTVRGGCLHTSTGLRKYCTPSLCHSTAGLTGEKWVLARERVGLVSDKVKSSGIRSSNLAGSKCGMAHACSPAAFAPASTLVRLFFHGPCLVVAIVWNVRE